MAYQLEVGTAIGCPMRCAYCPQTPLLAAYKGPRVMSLETFITCIRNTPADMPVSFASFAEPYINPQTSDMVGWLYANGRAIQMYTTGYKMTLRDVDILRRCEAHRVTLHIPSTDGKMNLTITPEYVETCKHLLATGPLDVACFGPVPEPLKFLTHHVKHSTLQTRAGNVAILRSPERKTGPIICNQQPLLDGGTLLPNGDYELCCQDYGLRHILGNLLTQSLAEILAGPVATALREAMAADGDCICRTCEYSSCVPNS